MWKIPDIMANKVLHNRGLLIWYFVVFLKRFKLLLLLCTYILVYNSNIFLSWFLKLNNSEFLYSFIKWNGKILIKFI